MGSAEVRILDKHGVREETGSDIFVGGVLNPGSGGIHPLNYLRGLADGVARRGVPIFQEIAGAANSGARVMASSPRRRKARCARSRRSSPPTAIPT